MTESGREIELKFHCAPEDLQAVLAAAPPGAEETRELISVYFDTPDRALERAGVSLRVRESDGRWIQTLKRGKGLFREEHEQPVDGFVLDPATPRLNEILPPAGVAALAPAFYVGVHRRQRLVRVDGAEIEIAIDQGEVRAVQGRSPISEVELELKAGPPAALFQLARQLLAGPALYLSFDGKAAVGQALTAGANPSSHGKQAVELQPADTAGEAFQAAARAALSQIARNAQLLRHAPSSEAVHQLRVATRRLRSVISLFAPILTDPRRDGLREGLRVLAKACDRARDLDVFARSGRSAARKLTPPPPGLAKLLQRVDAARTTAAGGVREVVSSAPFRGLLLDLSAWIETGAWRDEPDAAGLAMAFAGRRLDRQLKKLKRRAKRFDRADDERRHEVRIEAKKLRYAAETFASLYPADVLTDYVRKLKRLQDQLGALNDAAVAGPLAEGLVNDVETAFAAGELTGLRAAERPRRLAAAEKVLRDLAATPPFWR